ncbi:MAG: potassium-transporting ATPase subunit C [Opitutaceae bacterium]
MKAFLASLRLVAATIFVCCIAYPVILLLLGRLLFAENASGRLLRSPDGTIVGSRQIAQAFSAPEYFWPRPSAVDYNGAGAGGSNKAPANPVLAERARTLIERFGATEARPLPADLATASGSGLDPHISEAAALYQAERVASARGVSAERVAGMVTDLAFASGGPLAPDRIVNVLELNLSLDRSLSMP